MNPRMGGYCRVQAVDPMLRHLDLIEQIGMAVEDFEQFDQG
jgi:hypothetical protein